MIIRSPRKVSNFVTLDKAMTEDSSLSWGARGLLAFLLGKPDNWKISVPHLVKQGCGYGSGRDAIYRMLNELIDRFYIARKSIQSGVIYTVYDTPFQEGESVHHTDFQDTGSQDTGSQDTETPDALIKNDIKQGLKDLKKNDSEQLDSGLKPSSTEEKKKVKQANIATWEAYAKAYEKRYNAQPLRNAQINGIIARFVKSVPMDEAPLIARFYININSQFYVQKMHPVKLLLNDADSIRTQWATNKTMSTTTARQADQFQAATTAANGAAERYAKRHGIVFGDDALDGECKHV